MTDPTKANPDNVIVGYAAFLHRWINREEADSRRVPTVRGQNGNRNFTGEAESHSSYLLTRWHPSFFDCLEPGVRELVEGLIESWNCITYSSCEGHCSTKHQPLRTRCVRLLTTSFISHKGIVARAQNLCSEVNNASADARVVLVSSQASISLAEGFEAPGVDLNFVPTTTEETDYWKDLEFAYRNAIEAVKTSVYT